MTCKDCIHYDVCVIVEHSDTDYDHYSEYGCEDFKNKADFVEVVRCGECESVFHDKETNFYWCAKMNGKSVEKDHFCSYGERRAEE